MDGAGLPPALLDEIRTGNVIAFVGAGFSRPAGLPLWGPLLQAIAEEKCAGAKEIISKLTSSRSAQDLDLAAQILSDEMTQQEFQAALRSKLSVNPSTLPTQMQDRLRWLHGVPFAAILTTNFDELLGGADVQDSPRFGEFAARVLRERLTESEQLARVAVADTVQHLEGYSQTSPVLKLHGDASRQDSTLICTREGYRALLHTNARYSTFLRTLMATRTLLFIGFSFTDNYLNELRSEIVSMFAGKHGQPLSYAILNDIEAEKASALLKHDGLEVISFSSHGGKDFSGLDRLLSELHTRTNPTISVGRVLTMRSIIWLHTSWETSTTTKRMVEYLWKASGGQCTMTAVSTAEEALLKHRNTPHDVIVCCMASPARPDLGRVDGTRATGDLLTGLRSTHPKQAPPVIVLSYEKGDQANMERPCILRGAYSFITTYWELLDTLTTVLNATRPPETAAASPVVSRKRAHREEPAPT